MNRHPQHEAHQIAMAHTSNELNALLKAWQSPQSAQARMRAPHMIRVVNMAIAIKRRDQMEKEVQ